MDVEIAKKSVTFKTMLEDLGIEEGQEEEVPLPNVNSAILQKVLTRRIPHRLKMMRRRKGALMTSPSAAKFFLLWSRALSSS